MGGQLSPTLAMPIPHHIWNLPAHGKLTECLVSEPHPQSVLGAAGLWSCRVPSMIIAQPLLLSPFTCSNYHSLQIKPLLANFRKGSKSCGWLSPGESMNGSLKSVNRTPTGACLTFSQMHHLFNFRHFCGFYTSVISPISLETPITTTWRVSIDLNRAVSDYISWRSWHIIFRGLTLYKILSKCHWVKAWGNEIRQKIAWPQMEKNSSQMLSSTGEGS